MLFIRPVIYGIRELLLDSFYLIASNFIPVAVWKIECIAPIPGLRGMEEVHLWMLCAPHTLQETDGKAR
jgi:hypothetical protein